MKATPGQQTLWVMAAPDYTRSYIVRSNRLAKVSGLEGYTVLAEGPELSSAQVLLVHTFIADPEAYYSGSPVYRRFPHKPNFALRFIRESTTFDLMIDLHNPGWDFCCGVEQYRGWHWVDFTALAKALFPEYASPHPHSMWRKGAINSLSQGKAVKLRD
jgi:hypothetical protein